MRSHPSRRSIRVIRSRDSSCGTCGGRIAGSAISAAALACPLPRLLHLRVVFFSLLSLVNLAKRQAGIEGDISCRIGFQVANKNVPARLTRAQ